jgi:hypothetical protein
MFEEGLHVLNSCQSGSQPTYRFARKASAAPAREATIDPKDGGSDVEQKHGPMSPFDRPHAQE